MDSYPFEITFCDGDVEEIDAFNASQGAILAQAERIKLGKEHLIESVRRIPDDPAEAGVDAAHATMAEITGSK